MIINFNNKSLYINYPFTIFEIRNYLKDDDYRNLHQSFPNEKYFDKSDKGIIKDTFNSDSKKFNEFLSTNAEWKNFYESINSEKFIRDAFKESLIPNFKSRGISALKIWTLEEKKGIFKFLYRKVKVKFIFSRIYKSKKIMPHTDATGKLMSMIYYFADYNWPKESGGNTIFWKTSKKWNNWDNVHVPEIDYDDFSRENRILHESEYEPNKLIGFFKSECSWHSVKEINPKENKPRKVLNIFIRD